MKNKFEFFTLPEFECPCCNENKIDLDLIKKLDDLRFEMKRPLNINSGFRCEEHNKDCGGRRSSTHLIGIAADISVIGVSCELRHRLLYWAFILGFTGVGVYDTFIHVDIRKGLRSFWIND